jgi:hypothetical protein
MVPDMRGFDAPPGLPSLPGLPASYGSFALAGLQSWEQSGVMQELFMRALEKAGEEVAAGTPAMAPAPIGTPITSMGMDTPAWSPERLAAAFEPPLSAGVGMEWMDRFGSQQEALKQPNPFAAKADEQIDDEESFTFPALPIGSSPTMAGHLDG